MKKTEREKTGRYDRGSSRAALCLSVLEEQLSQINVQLLRLRSPFEQLPDMDFRYGIEFLKGFPYERLWDRLTLLSLPNQCLHFLHHECLNYYLFPVPEAEQSSLSAEYLLIGPVLFDIVPDAAYRSLIERYHIPSTAYANLQEFFNRVPIVGDLQVFLAMLYPLQTALLGENSVTKTLQDEQLEGNYSETEVKVAEDMASAISGIEARYQTEKELLQAITRGNSDEADLLLHKFVKYRLAPRNSNGIRDRKNISFVANTLFRKAVQEANVHPYHIDRLSTLFAISIENCTSIPQLDALSHTMVRRYCLLVRNYSRNGYSLLVQNSLDYIDSRFSEELSLSVLSRVFNVSGSYLSALFRKEVNMTLTDYIHTTRIKQAIRLLNSSALSVQTIALRCGYQDANYFARTFKRLKGMTPKEYRVRIGKE